jgi:hypothetical protein
VFADEGKNLWCGAVGERMVEVARRWTDGFKGRSFEKRSVEERSISCLQRKSLAKVVESKDSC